MLQVRLLDRHPVAFVPLLHHRLAASLVASQLFDAVHSSQMELRGLVVTPCFMGLRYRAGELSAVGKDPGDVLEQSRFVDSIALRL